jgi:hypothetical protein
MAHDLTDLICMDTTDSGKGSPTVPGASLVRGVWMRRRNWPAILVQLTRWLGIVLVAAGFGVVGLGWDAMARVSCVDCQLPYLLSAGATGIGLVVLGVGLLVIAQLRAERLRLADHLERLLASMGTTFESSDTSDATADARIDAGVGPSGRHEG